MAESGKIITLLEYVAARLMLRVLGWLPRFAAVGIGCGMGRLAYMVGGRLRRTGERNLELAFPELEEKQRSRLLHGSFLSLGRLLAEFSQLSEASREEITGRVQVRGLEHIDEAARAGKGVILFTGHIGAWELSSFALSALGYPLSFLVRRIDNRRVEELVEKMRTRLGNRSIDKRAAVRPMMRRLHGGGTVGILVDLNTQRHEGVFVNFFGIPACTTSGIASLALHTDAPVIPVFIPWDKKLKKFILRVDRPLQVIRTGDEVADVLHLTEQITAVVEKYVRLYPDQWLWIHKRWNTRPVGERDLYSRTSDGTEPIEIGLPSA